MKESAIPTRKAITALAAFLFFFISSNVLFAAPIDTNGAFKKDSPKSAPESALSMEPSTKSFYEKYICDRLSVGIKLAWPSLQHNDRPQKPGKGFVGHVNRLEDEDMMVAVSLEYQIFDYLRLEFSNYRISATTMNYNNHLTDGDVKMKGPYVGIKLQVPLFDGTVIPYISGGCAFLSGDFKEAYWWHNGWASEESWKSMGSPKERRTPYFREIHVDDVTEFIYGFGVTFHIFDRFELDGFMTFCDSDPACEYGYTRKGVFDKHQDGDFDLKNYQMGFCARLVF